MHKSTLFISAALTTFTLAMIAGVVASAYQGTFNSTGTVSQTSPTVEAVVQDPPPPAQVLFTPEQAAALAAQLLGRTDLYSVETADLNGASVFMVTFSSGDVVYISPDGQILAVTKLQSTVTTSFQSNRSNGGGIATNNHDGEHEEHEENEEHDD